MVGRHPEASSASGDRSAFLEDAAATGANVGRGDEKLDGRAHQPVEVDAAVAVDRAIQVLPLPADFDLGPVDINSINSGRSRNLAGGR